jgi:hypothetical protein
MSRPRSADFPPGTEFYDVDGTPVACLPGQPPKRFDTNPPADYDAQDLFENGVMTTREDFLAMIARIESASRP